MAVSFIGGGNPEYPEKPTDLQQVTDILLYTTPLAGFELTTSVVIGTDYISSCKSNYHTITATTTPPLFSVLIPDKAGIILSVDHDFLV